MDQIDAAGIETLSPGEIVRDRLPTKSAAVLNTTTVKGIALRLTCLTTERGFQHLGWCRKRGE